MLPPRRLGRLSLLSLSLSLSLSMGAACASTPPANPHVKERTVSSPADPTSSVTTVKEEPKPEPFRATSGPGDAPTIFVRDERSSRLDAPFPKGERLHAREAWRAPLPASRDASSSASAASISTKTQFVLAAGNRVAVVGSESWIVFDTNGRRAETGKVDGSSGARLDRVSGAIVPDETRSADLPPDAKVAAHKGLVVMVKNGGVHVGERAIEGKFEAFDVAIDDREIACVIVRQADDLSLWTVPLSASGGIGRQRIPTAKRALGPPVLGKNLRVLLLDIGIVAIGLDGKRVWERRGVPTGGVSITSDDHVLIADNGKVLALDPRGHVTELYSANDVVFVTPPILNAGGLLLVASGSFLHALSFS